MSSILHSSTSGNSRAGVSHRSEENVEANLASKQFASLQPAKRYLAAEDKAQKPSPLRRVCLDTPYEEAAAPDSPSLHSLSYSTEATGLDRSTFSACLIGDGIAFTSTPIACNESLCRVNYFSKPNIQYVKDRIWEQTVFCSDFGLEEVWTGKHSELCRPAMMPSTQRPSERILRIEYARKIAAQTQRFYEADRTRQAMLRDSMNSSRQAKTAILASIPESSTNDSATMAFNTCRVFSSNRPQAVALAAAEETLARKHRWSQLADVRLASQYAQLDSMESILFLKQTLRLLDTEFISFRKSFNTLLSSSAEDRPHIDIDGFQCPRHLVVQYHKRHLFRKIKKLHQTSIDLSTLCMEMSIQFSCTEAIWLIESRDPRAAFQYALDAMNRAAAAENEDGWTEAYMVLKAVYAMFNEDSRRYRSVVTEVRLFTQYAAAKLEFVFCKKLLHAAYFHHQLCFWGDFKFHFDAMQSQWAKLNEAIEKTMSMDSSMHPSVDVMDTIYNDTKLAHHVMSEWNICVLTRIAQFYSFKWRSIIQNFNHDRSVDNSSEELFRNARHSLMKCYKAACSLHRAQTLWSHTEEENDTCTTFSLEEVLVIVETIQSKLFSLFEEHSAALMLRAKDAIRSTTTSKIEVSSGVVSMALFETNVNESASASEKCESLNLSICGFIEEIEAIRKEYINISDAHISDKNETKKQYFQAMTSYSKVQRNYCKFLPTEVLASSIFEKIRRSRSLDSEIKIQLSKYMTPGSELLISTWKVILGNVETAISEASKIVRFLRDKRVVTVFKMSPFHCGCCTLAAISRYTNCRCQIIEHWVEDLTAFIDTYNRKIQLEKGVQQLTDVEMGPENSKQMWICLRDLMNSVKKDSSLVTTNENDLNVICQCEDNVQDRLDCIEIEQKLKTRRSHASRLITVMSSAALVLLVFSSLRK